MKPENERTEEFVTAQLADLRHAMHSEAAPSHVARNVMAAYHDAHRHRQPRRTWMKFAAAAACAGAIAGVFAWRLSRPVPRPPAPIIARMVPPVVPVAATQAKAAQMTQAATVRKQVVPAAKPARRTEEFATDFLALPFAPPLPDDASAQVIRVRLPRSAMRTVGLPFDERRAFERVPADILLGEDGLARAVRFVKVAR